MNRIRGLVWPISLLIASSAAAFVEPEQATGKRTRVAPPKVSARSERLDFGEPSPLGAAARALVLRHGGEWTFDVDRRIDRPDLVQGSGIPLIPGKGNSLARSREELTLDTVEPLARAFVQQNAALLHPARGRLELDPALSSLRRGGGLVSVYYRWEVDGLEVEGAGVFVRINSGNITQFGAPRIGSIGLDTEPLLGSDAAVARLMHHTGDEETYQLRSEPRLLIQPQDGAAGELDYRLVWTIAYRTEGAIENWEGRVDAHTGEVVGFRDTNQYAHAVGGVYPRTVFDGNETRAPFPLLDVVVDGLTVTSDTSGGFAYTGGPASSGLDGRFFNTNCQGCSNPAQPTVQTGLGTGWLDFGSGGQDEQGNGFSTPADRNTFFHLNQVRRVALKWLPGLAWLGSVGFSSIINIEDTCNAVYTGNAVNFFRSGGGCNNTGEISDVIYHEWGHGLDGNTRGGGGGTGEGTADVTSMHLTHDSLMGPGFGTGGGAVRNLDSATSPFGLLTFGRVQAGDCNILVGGGLSVHCVGQVYGQTAWELAQALAARYGHHTGWRTSERLFFTSLPDAGTYEPVASFSIYDAYINADDDDGNLANGTPNATEIFDAFDRHEIARTQLPASTPCTGPDQPVLDVQSACDRFDLSWAAVTGADGYQVLRAELREDTAYIPVANLGSAENLFTDNEVIPGVDYRYVVMAIDAAGCESTVENPVAARLPTQPVLTLTAVVDDDTPRGNRSGFPDPDEEVDLVLTLHNLGETDASGLSGTITSTTLGVTIVDGTASWSTIPVSSSADSQDALRFQADGTQVACGDLVQFELVPDEASGCATETSYFEVRMGEFDGSTFVCDPTPACFVQPDFAGIEAATSGASCAEIDLAWQAATSNCVNATISYNIYRSTDPGFTPGPGNLVANVASTFYGDILLQPGQIYHYVVRAFDSRSGEDANSVLTTAISPAGADSVAPLFGGLQNLATGEGCGEVELDWAAAQESCSAPVSYDVHRSTDPGFTPGPGNLIATSLSPSFTDAALDAAQSYTYVVRARDSAGNVDGNDVRLTADSGIIDLVHAGTEFEPDDGGWQLTLPNDASAGNWAWGDPQATAYQPEDDATPDGVNCWMTGLATGPSNDDIDNGTTTLISALYDLSAAVDPVVRYARWFTNDRGSAPGEITDLFRIEVSNNNGADWSSLEIVGSGTPLDWVRMEFPLSGIVAPTDQMRFRFTASDLANGSLVEAGIDDFEVVDPGLGCSSCALPVQSVGTIDAIRSGDDVVLDWTADPVSGARFAVYVLSSPTFDDALLIGTTDGRSFVHEGAMLSGESFSYRVSALNDCGDESGLE